MRSSADLLKVAAIKASLLMVMRRNAEAILLNRCTLTVANFDRRQKTFLEMLKKLIGGFVRLFRPSVPVPTREQVAAALKQKQDRYACLERITNAVHRSQLKEVIDYTLKHPIVHRGKTRDDFTLANAARAVWNTRHAIWEKIPGSFKTFNQLKAACYNLQEAKDDPFAYQSDNR